MDAGAVDALIGVGAGAMLGFASAQVSGIIRRKARGRAAARLVWTELSRSEALADGAHEFGQGAPPVVPRFAFWESHSAELAEVVDPDVLIDLEIAYGSAEMLGKLLTGEMGSGTENEFQEFVSQLRAAIVAGKAAVQPYGRRRSLWHAVSWRSKGRLMEITANNAETRLEATDSGAATER